MRGGQPRIRLRKAIALGLLTAVLGGCDGTGAEAANQPSPGTTALGDWGHFLSMRPRIHLNNPEGRAFALTFHTMLWPNARWNPESVSVRVVDPTGSVVFWDAKPVQNNRIDLEVAEGEPGVYVIDWGRSRDGDAWAGPNFWLETDLPGSVVWTGDPSIDAPAELSAVEQRRPFFQASVPRRWWFWVPEDVSRFVIRAQRTERHMSQREAWGLIVHSPRGQRVDVLWGQPPRTARSAYRQEMEREIMVVPGSSGRFWSIEVRNGDAHQYASVNFTFEGLPPYIARSPEEWFDGDTGERPPVSLYDTSPYVQAAYVDPNPERWPHLEHWVPSPSLGDPDGVQIRGPGRFALWNPEGRVLALALADYVPRSGANGRESVPTEADVVITDATGSVSRQAMTVPHYHGNVDPPQPVAALEHSGVHTVAVNGVERWWAFTYPATPLVLLGEETSKGGRFTLEVGTARNWYLLVPPGTSSFRVRASAAHATDVFLLEVNAPDRTVALVHGREGEMEVDVPGGLDGKVWHLRADIASASRLVTEGRASPRYLGVYLTLELVGVPPILSPTWEQWFDPADPVPPFQRSGIENR